MVNILSVQTATGGAKELAIRHKGADYIVNAKGELYNGAKKIEGKEAGEVLDKVIKEVNTEKLKLAPDVLKQVEDQIGDFAKVNAEVDQQAAKTLRKALKGAAEITSHTADHAKNGAILSGTEAEHFLSKSTIQQMANPSNPGGAFNWGKLKQHRVAQSEWEKLVNGKPTPENIEATLIKHHSEHTKNFKLPDEVEKKFIQDGKVVDIAKIHGEIDKEVTSGTAKLETTLKDLKQKSSELVGLSKTKTPTVQETQKITKLTDEINTLKTDIKTITSTKYGGKIVETLKDKDKDLVKEMTDLHKEVGTHFDSAMKSVGKAVENEEKKPGFLARHFTNTQEHLAGVAKKEGKTIEELGTKVGSVRWGKVAGAAAIVTAAYLVGTGLFGKKQKEVNDRRNEPQTPALGVA